MNYKYHENFAKRQILSESLVFNLNNLCKICFFTNKKWFLQLVRRYSNWKL